ncbi:hypothetical protein B0T22DRAFT_266766 [Podospora appendiculata]|uniref:DUF7918 domain-containing protein n=1 Tax=Podospora appendiculata TaxID=314037 RepID=A0AAE1C994_9PEZI|nr:hypothetical protein B0T22DRAFT_266766 [Podospora appendiculata]
MAVGLPQKGCRGLQPRPSRTLPFKPRVPSQLTQPYAVTPSTNTMAVITELPGIEAIIVVNGTAAKEYVDTDADEKQDRHDCPTVVQYIESVPGASFAFRFVKDKNFRHSSHHIAIKFSVDGMQSGLKHVDYTSHNKKWETTKGYLTLGNPKDGYQRGRFQFAKLDVVNDDDLSDEEKKKSLSERAKNLGTLKVLIYHMKPSVELRGPPKTFDRGLVVMKVAEKALKGRAIDCRTNFDCVPRSSRRPSETRPAFEDPERRPFAIFEFRYRSKEGLMQEGIIPRPRPADEVDDMSEAEARRLAREFLELRRVSPLDLARPSLPRTRLAHRIKAKSENEDVKVKTETKRGIKRESSEMGDTTFMSRYKARRLDGGSLEVDLTDD